MTRKYSLILINYIKIKGFYLQNSTSRNMMLDQNYRISSTSAGEEHDTHKSSHTSSRSSKRNRSPRRRRPQRRNRLHRPRELVRSKLPTEGLCLCCSVALWHQSVVQNGLRASPAWE